MKKKTAVHQNIISTLSGETEAKHICAMRKVRRYPGVLVFALVAANTSPALSQTADVYEISATSGQYLQFDLSGATSEPCRRGPPDYPLVTGLPAGMFYNGNCGIYGSPEGPVHPDWCFPSLAVSGQLTWW